MLPEGGLGPSATATWKENANGWMSHDVVEEEEEEKEETESTRSE